MKMWPVFLILLATSACLHTLRVEPPEEEPADSTRITRFVVVPPVIRSGETAVLYWNVRNTDSVVLESVPERGAYSTQIVRMGRFSPAGQLQVHPQSTMTYILSCGPDEFPGCTAASVSLVVK